VDGVIPVADSVSYGDFIEAVYDSDPLDWEYVDSLDVYVCQKNIAFTIKEAEEKRRPFDEDWLSRFPNKNADMVFFNIRYNGVPIAQFQCVHVDGFRAYLPLPNLERMTVNRDDYLMACRVNNSQTKTDEYMKRAGFTIKYE
jgi:hypothetical protein